MNEIEYREWKTKIKMLMKADKEDDDFIEYLLSWFDRIKGKEEIKLVQKYHPDMKNKSEEEILKLIYLVRYTDPSEKYFLTYLFDSAFFFYRPMLRKQYTSTKEENYAIL